MINVDDMNLLPDCDWSGHAWVVSKSKLTHQQFRREFSLDRVETDAVLHITAQEKYRVHINGHWVGDGPRRGNPQVYRSYLVGQWLHKGENVLSVETYHSQGQGRFACQLDGLEGDKGWLHATHPVLQENTPGSTLLSPVEIADLRPDTRREDYCDALLEPISEAMVRDPAPPDTRSMALPERIVRMAEVIELHEDDPQDNVALRLAYEAWDDPTMHRIERPEGLVDPPRGPVKISPIYPSDPEGYHDFHRECDQAISQRSPTFLLDFGRLINGHFSFDIETEGGAQIDIGYSQVLFAGRPPTVLYAGDRTWGNKADRVLLGPGRQTWESFHWEQARYVQITIRGLIGPVQIHRFGLVDRQAPLPERGRFECSDPVLTELWKATIRTVQATTCDLFTDNCIREKLAFGGECGTRSLMTCWIATGNVPIARHFIRQFTRDPEASRCFLAYSADEAATFNADEPVHFFHPLQLWYALSQYHLFAAPEEYAKDKVLPALRAFVAYLDSLAGDQGLIERHPGYAWMDWVPGAWSKAWGGGVGAPQNLFYCLVLQGLANAESAMGNTEVADSLFQRAKELGASFDALFWNPERGLYADVVVDGRQRSDQYSEHTNALAILAGICGAERSTYMLSRLEAVSPDLIRADAAFTHFLASASFRAGRAENALNLLRSRFGPMLKLHANPTLWEERSYLMTIRDHRWQGRYRSLAHSASAVPAYLLSTEVLGIKPTARGFEACDICPQPGGLSWAEGSVPTPAGDIHMRWEQHDHKFTLEIKVPDPIQTRVYLPLSTHYELNGVAVSTGRREGARYVLRVGPGEHHLTASNTPDPH